MTTRSSTDRYARRVPSGDMIGSRLPLPATMIDDVPSTGLPARIAPISSMNTIWPLAAGPNGAGTRGRLPARSRAPTTRPTMSNMTAMAARIGMRGVTASRFVRADTGSHLSGNVQPGRCRVRSTWPRMSSKYSGARVGASESRITGRRRSNRSFALMRSALREPVRAFRARRPRASSASHGANGAAGTSRFPGGSAARRRRRAAASRGSSAGRRRRATPASAGAARCRQARARQRRPSKSPTDGIARGVSSTSMERRRRRLATSRQAFTVKRWSQASNRSGSRNPGRSFQARTIASWTASRASSPSRRMSRAAESSRATATPASSAKASLSPRCARMTRSRWSTVAPVWRGHLVALGC